MWPWFILLPLLAPTLGYLSLGHVHTTVTYPSDTSALWIEHDGAATPHEVGPSTPPEPQSLPTPPAPVAVATQDEPTAPADAAVEPLPADAHELQVEPSRVVYPANRPAWVEQPARRRQGEADLLTVSSDPFALPSEARRDLDARLDETLVEYVDDWVGRAGAAQRMGFDGRAHRRRLLAEDAPIGAPARRYDEVVQFPPPLGAMHQSHALVVIDEAFRREISDAWRRTLATQRLVQTALVVGLVLGLMAVLAGYFRLERSAGGEQSRRLQFGAAAVILAVIAAGMWAAKSMVWL